MSHPLTVEEIMTTAVIALRSHDLVSRARDEMLLAGFRHIPVVDERNHVVGIISDRDVLAALGGAAKLSDPMLVTVMKTHVRTVRRETTARDAVSLLLEHKIGALPVLGEDGQIVGIVTETDFLALAREALETGRLGRTEASTLLP